MDKYIGKMLGGRYEIIDVVGVGGMAVVYRARCHVLNRYVAIKILKEEYAKDPDIRKRFSIESQAVAKLSHHNIVSVYDVGNDNGLDYIVMELIEGITLKEYLQKKGHLPWQEALFFAQQICRALMHAHSRGIIHQDIKPQNVIILRDGTAKLTDFGIASFATTQETRVVQEAIGSVHYISPEQAKGAKIDYRTDIYSLGVVMYEMLTGKLPFQGETALQVVMQHINAVPLHPIDIQPDIPQGMDAIVMHAMCANINKRYATAQELLADLDAIKANANTRFDYNLMSDEVGETQVLGREVQNAARHAPAATAERERRAPSAKRYEEEPRSFFERLAERPGLAAGLAVAVVAVIALCVTGVLLFTGGGGDGAEKLSVPALVGRTIDEVRADAEVTEHFSIQEAAERVESNRPEGEILEQDPRAGTEAEKGSIITLTVSAGGKDVDDSYKIVDFKGKSLEYVDVALKEHEVAYKTEEEFSGEVEKGKVTRTDPAAGSMLEKGATLTVYISKGKEKTETQVPNLYGMTESAAQHLLEEKKLGLGTADKNESDAAVGTVIWQSVDKGSTVSEGTVVNIQISKGKTEKPKDPAQPDPNETTPPEPSGGEMPPENSGGDNNAPSEPATGSAMIQVALPGNTDIAHVVISVDGNVKYDQTHATAAGSVSVKLTGTAGQHEVTISIDGNTTTSTHTFS